MSAVAIQSLQELLGRPEGSWTLADGALSVCRLRGDEVDGLAVFDRLADLGEKARNSIGGAVHPRFVAAGVARTLFRDEGFRAPAPGDEAPAHLYLDRALDLRKAAPPLLALLFIEVARRTGHRFDAISLPGAALLRRDHAGSVQLFDPANEARAVSIDDCRRMRPKGAGEFREGWLRPASSQQVLARLLAALKALHWRAGEHEAAENAIRMLLVIRPEDPREIRDLGRLLFLAGRFGEAIEAFEDYLAHNPDGEDADAVRMLLIEARAGLTPGR